MTSTYLKNKRKRAYPYKVMDNSSTVLRSIIFDCDGVLMDSEPLHFSAFKKVLGAAGQDMSEEVYKEQYLALDDKGAFKAFYEKAKAPLSEGKLGELMAQKTLAFQQLIQEEGILPFPAVPEFVMAVAQRYPLAVASGARRHELELVLESAGIRSYFEAIISADDVQNGKPHPESYLKAVEALNATGKRTRAIRPEECLVIEDSKQGIASAHLAGMKCIAVATSYPTFELKVADLVVPSIAALRISQLEDLFNTPKPLPLASPQNN